jgi:hypothetical protein
MPWTFGDITITSSAGVLRAFLTLFLYKPIPNTALLTRGAIAYIAVTDRALYAALSIITESVSKLAIKACIRMILYSTVFNIYVVSVAFVDVVVAFTAFWILAFPTFCIV